MNRNAIVGAGLVALVLAALAVGISTYVSSQGIDQSTEELRSEVAKTGESVSDLAAKAVMSDGGTAENLTTVSSLRAEGQLAVMSDESATEPIFLVGQNAGGAVEAVVKVPLTVDSATTLADLTADEIKATVVSAQSLETASKSFVASDNGNVNADGGITIGRNAAIGGDLTVSGAKFSAGTVVGGVAPLVFDSSFVPVTAGLDSTVASRLGLLRGRPVLAVNGGIISSSLVLNDTNGSGGLTVNGGDVTATGRGVFGGTLSAAGGKFTVDADGNVTSGAIKSGAITSGDITSGSIVSAGSVTAALRISTLGEILGKSIALNQAGAFSVDEFGNIVSGGSLSVLKGITAANGAFSVDEIGAISAAGNIRTGADVLAAGDIVAEGNVGAVDIAASGNVGGVDFNATGDISGVNIDASGNVSAVDVTATGKIDAGTDVSAAGNIMAVGSITGGSVVTAGDITGGSFTLGDGTSFSVDGSGNLSGQDASLLSLAVGSTQSEFTVDSAGNGYLAGSLTVDQLATFGGDVVIAGGVSTPGDGPVVINDDLNVVGSLNFTGKIHANDKDLNVRTLTVMVDKFSVDTLGNVAAAGDLSVAGASNFVGAVTADTINATTLNLTTLNVATLAVSGDATVGNNLTVTGNISAANLPNVLAGTVTVNAGSTPVAAAGLASGANVVISPRSAAGAYYVESVTDGSFTINSDADATFSWIASW